MTPQAFVEKWQRANLSERSACQQHFLDLCELLGQPKPADADPDGTSYTFGRVRKTTIAALGLLARARGRECHTSPGRAPIVKGVEETASQNASEAISYRVLDWNL